MKIALIDLFCGAGGTTTGVEGAKMFGKKIAKVIACVNHDEWAIRSHKSNHKGVLHYTEDIRTLNLNALIKLVLEYRAKGYVIALWASLECTNFSNAKGGMPRDADSRTLAEHLIRYIQELCPDYIFIENVMEFMSWGPLDASGKPVSRDKGKDYIKWVDDIKAYGYKHDWAKIDSADYGAHTSRKRYFGIFASGSYPVVFPKATHSKNPGSSADLFSEPLKKWRPVKEVLDLRDEGKSIFDRKKPLSDKTHERILDGLLKYIAGGADAFITKYYSSGGELQGLDSACGTLTTKDRMALITSRPFILNYNSSTSPCTDSEKPCPTITVARTHYIVNPAWFGNIQSVDQPACTIVARQDKAPVYLITASHGDFKIPVYDTDSEMLVKIKQFMALYNIADIKMRMLKVNELLKIQGFPANYILKGNQAQQKKFIGNSVVPVVSEMIIKETYRAIIEQQELLDAA